MIWLIIFVISGLAVAMYDMYMKEFPSLLLFTNYFCLCMLTSPVFFIGVIPIAYCYYHKQPVDLLYLFILFYLILITPFTEAVLLTVVAMLAMVLFTKEEKIGFMAPLEMALATLLVR